MTEIPEEAYTGWPTGDDAKVAVLTDAQGENPLVIRANPSEEDIRSFAEVHLAKFHAGERGGPGGAPAVKVTTARFYDSEVDYNYAPDDKFTSEIDLTELDPYHNN